MDYADASSLPERTNLYLNSVNRMLSTDSPNNFEIVIGDSLVSAGPEEVFYINVIQFNTVNNFIKFKMDIIQIFKLYYITIQQHNKL